MAQSNGVEFRAIFEVCDDKRPRGGHTCEQQKAWGKCEERWFVEGKYCRQTCGKCKAFDLRTTEVTIRGAMNQCKLKDKQTETSCLDALQGECAKGDELLEEARTKHLKAQARAKAHARANLFERRPTLPRPHSPSLPPPSDASRRDLQHAGRSSDLRIHSNPRDAPPSIEEYLESETFYRLFETCKVDCLVKKSSEQLVHSLVTNFLEDHPTRSKNLEKILTPDSASRVLLDFFKYVGCSMEQFVVVVPKLYRALLEHSPALDRELLGKIYRIQGFHEASNATITYTGAYLNYPSPSTCLAKSLKTFLSVRKCDGGGGGYHCYKGG